MAHVKEILFGLALLVSVVTSLTTLDSKDEQQKSGFGGPSPRHGGELLRWYVRNCVNNNMMATCDPTLGKYGFHEFKNSPRLLPEIKDKVQYGYYTVGNLNVANAKDLPEAVRGKYDPKNKMSNYDRVVVKYNKNSKHIADIYASAHYEPNKTYKIGSNLIKYLREPPPIKPKPSEWQTANKKNGFKRVFRMIFD